MSNIFPFGDGDLAELDGAPTLTGLLAEAAEAGVFLSSATASATYSVIGETSQTLATALPVLTRRIREHNDATPLAIKIGGLGSSVGVGASLLNAAAEAPVARLAAVIAPILNPLGNLAFTTTNGSVNGSVIASALGPDQDYADLKALAGGKVDLLVLAYGMNDGAVASYHAGQTYPAVHVQGSALIDAARADGADVVIFTSPHPHSGRNTYTMPGGIAVSYPAANQQIPDATAAQSVKTITLPDGRTVPAGYRHLRVNEALRSLGADKGVVVLDAERYWFEAVATFGEDALFNAGEIVHPNLLGHQLSYWKAIDAFARSLQRSRVSSGSATAMDVRVRKGTDQIVKNTTATVLDSALRFPVKAGERWAVEVDLYYLSGTVPDLQIGWSVPAGSTGRWGVLGLEISSGATPVSSLLGVSTTLDAITAIAGAGSPTTARLSATVRAGADGEVAFRFAQFAADPTDTTVLADSILRAQRL